MQNENLTFNDIPQVVAQLRDEVMGMRAMLSRQQVKFPNGPTSPNPSCRRGIDTLHAPLSVEFLPTSLTIPLLQEGIGEVTASGFCANLFFACYLTLDSYTGDLLFLNCHVFTIERSPMQRRPPGGPPR